MPDTTVKKISVNKILVSNETPATTIAGKLWLNPSETPRPRLYEYNGTAWVRCGDTVTIDGVTLTIEQVVENLGTYIDTSLEKKVDWNILENNEIILKQSCDMAQQTYSPTNICSIDLAKPYSYCFNYRMNFKSYSGYVDTIFSNYNYTAGWKIFYSLDTSSSYEYVYNVYFEYVDQDSSKSISSTLIDFPCTDDELHTLVVAYTGSEFKIYIDGTLKNTFTTTATSYNVTPIIYRMGDYYTQRNLRDIYVFNFDITDAGAPYTLTNYLNGNVIPTNLLGGTFYTTKPSMGLDNASDWNITSALTVDRQQGGWLCKAGVAYCKQRSADLPTGVEKALDLNTTTSSNYYLSDTTDKIDHLAGKTVRVKISFWARKNSTDKTTNTYLHIYAGYSSLYSVSGSTASDNNWHKYETTKNVSINSYNTNIGINIRAYVKANTFTDYAWSIADLHVELIGAAVALENYVYYEDVDYYTNCPLLKDTSANGNNYYSSYGPGSNYADNSILANNTFKPDLVKILADDITLKNYSEDNSSGYRNSRINAALAEGFNTQINTNDSYPSAHAEGCETKATGSYGPHAEGYGTTASGNDGAHAEGSNTTASGNSSHAEGYCTTASAYSGGAHSEGYYATASGDYSHAENENTTASGTGSHAEGYYTVAASDYQHVQGKYNVVDNNNTYADIIGGGSSSGPKNIYTVDWNGNVVAEGNISGKVNGSTVSLSSLSADISTKAADSEVVHLAGAETITGPKTFNDGTSNSTTVHSSGVSVTGSGFTTSLDYQGINFNTGRLEGVLGDLTSRSATTVLNSQATYNELELKQNKTDENLNTEDKTVIGAINELNTDVQTLQLDKVNRGELWIGDDGKIEAPKTSNPSYNSFSYAFECNIKYEDTLNWSTYTAVIGTALYGATSAGWLFTRTNATTILFRTNNGTTGTNTSFNSEEKIKKLFDGTKKRFVVCGNATKTKLYVDGVLLTTNNITYSKDFDYGLYFSKSNTFAKGKFSRIKVFNFDMSEADAPYTLADYQNGKDEPPSLHDINAEKRAFLSLQDYTFNGEVLDASGNNNNATISGSVAGTNDEAVKQLFQNLSKDSEVVKKVNNIAPTSGNVTIKSNDIALTSNITVNGFTMTTVQNCLGKLNSEKVNTPVVGALSALTTTDKTSIVSAVNELNSKLLASTPAPITNAYTISSIDLTAILSDTIYAGIQGKILISPNINNLGAIYVGQGVTDKETAFPLYPNQIISFSFTDITTFNVTGDILGDKFNYVIEFGLLNSAVTPANGLVVLGTNGSQYRLDPTGDAGSETFTLTKIS